MPVVTKYICDGCGKEKGLTNHWFMFRHDPEDCTLYTWIQDEEDSGVTMFCGESCVLAAISKWMQERKEQDTETGKG